MKYGCRRFLLFLLSPHNDGIEVGLAGARLDLLPLRLPLAVGEEQQAEAFPQLGEHGPRVLGQRQVLQPRRLPQVIALGRQVAVRLPADGLLDRLLPVRNPQVCDAHLGGIVALLEELGLHLIADGAGLSFPVVVLGLQGAYHLQGTRGRASGRCGAARRAPGSGARPRVSGGGSGTRAAPAPRPGREPRRPREGGQGQYLLDGAPPRRGRVDQRVVQVEEHRLDAVQPHGAASRESRPARTAEGSAPDRRQSRPCRAQRGGAVRGPPLTSGPRGGARARTGMPGARWAAGGAARFPSPPQKRRAEGAQRSGMGYEESLPNPSSSCGLGVVLGRAERPRELQLAARPSSCGPWAGPRLSPAEERLGGTPGVPWAGPRRGIWGLCFDVRCFALVCFLCEGMLTG